MSPPSQLEGWCSSTRTPARQDPWILRKSVVIIILVISIWAFYVAVGRVFVPAIRQATGSVYSRPAGIGLLFTFIVLWLMFEWSYITIITRSAGAAIDWVVQSEDPNPVSDAMYDDDTRFSRTAPPPPSPPLPPPHPPPPLMQDSEAQPSIDGHIPADLLAPLPEALRPRQYDVPVKSEGPVHIHRPVPYVSGEPRYCRHCRIVKPDRAHHCRHCGTCILQFDHHCMWVGRCVGWGNHAVFVTFNLWSGLFCLYCTVILLIDIIGTSGPLDGQKIALVGICGFLCVFTLLLMLPTHVTLILSGKSTVESFETSTQRRREDIVLQQAFNSSFWVTKEMRQTKRRWKEEYGGVAVNDRWVWGTKWDLWRQEMGSNWMGWILPIGRPRGDGLSYRANPRFGPNGEWLPQRDWPKVIALP